MDPVHPRDTGPEPKRRSTHDLGATVPATAFSPEGLRAHLARVAQATPAAGTASDDVLLLAKPSLVERLRGLGFPLPPRHQLRYDAEAVLGTGATGCVRAFVDHDLERPVAVKQLLVDGPAEAESLSRFIAEARITASLEHPNVLPIHEIDVSERGELFFIMKKIDGGSLGTAIGSSEPGRRAAPLDDANAIASVFIGICQALAYAHHRGVVHQDIKPDNIMLGAFGEVLVVDWGSAVRLSDPGERPLYGTPLYMSPEQARREGIDPRSDVYCIGATLFHALLLRPPTWADDSDEFWRRKRAGEIDAPSAPERATVPAPLLAIALKALAADPAARYRDADAMLRDLRDYQAGLAVSALRESPWQRLRRWHRRHARTFWPWTVAAGVIVSLALTLYGERLKELARWGRPVVDETFADDSWKSRWLPCLGAFERRDGRLESVAEGRSVLVLDRRFAGATAVEYEAEMLPGGHPGDLSLMCARDAVFSADHQRVERLVDPYRLQIGAWYGSCSCITDDGNRVLAYAAFKPVTGRRYRVRAEVDGDRIDLTVDGRHLCTWNAPFPFAGGYVALYTESAAKAFDQVRIYQRETPELVRATALGDADAVDGLYDHAAAQYRRVSDSHAGSALGDEARFKEGLCRWRQDRRDEANERWTPLQGGRWWPQVRLLQLEQEAADGRDESFLAGLTALCRDDATDIRRRAATLWGSHVEQLLPTNGRRMARGTAAVLNDYLRVHDQALTDQPIADVAAGRALLALGRDEELLRRFPSQTWLCSRALLALGADDRIIADYPEQLGEVSTAHFDRGEFDQLPPNTDLYRFALLWSGHAAEILERYPTNDAACAQALAVLGRLDEALARARAVPSERARILCLMGREDEITEPQQLMYAHLARGDAATLDADPCLLGSFAWYAPYLAGIDQWLSGKRAEARASFADAWQTMSGRSSHPLLPDLLPTWLDGVASGDFASFDRACADCVATRRYEAAQRSWYAARFLLGQIDEAGFRDQPARIAGERDMLLYRAMRGERRGEGAAALADYRAYLAMPRWQRVDRADGGLERLVSSRIAALSRQDP
jgi:serine/threonine protein kinase